MDSEDFRLEIYKDEEQTQSIARLQDGCKIFANSIKIG